MRIRWFKNADADLDKIYAIDMTEKVVKVLKVRHRKEVYKSALSGYQLAINKKGPEDFSPNP